MDIGGHPPYSWKEVPRQEWGLIAGKRTEIHTDRNTERQRDPETWRDTETLSGTTHLSHLALPCLWTRPGSPHSPLHFFQGASGGLVRLCPKGESQASILGFILRNVGVGTSHKKVPSALELSEPRAPPRAEYGCPRHPSVTTVTIGAWFQDWTQCVPWGQARGQLGATVMRG